jgi:hypothetical protein
MNQDLVSNGQNDEQLGTKNGQNDEQLGPGLVPQVRGLLHKLNT